MYLLIVLALIFGTAGVLISLEVSRRAIAGRRMERSMEALRSETLAAPDLTVPTRAARTRRPTARFVPTSSAYGPREVQRAS